MTTPLWTTEARRLNKAHGICVQCGKREAIPSRTQCGYCSELTAERTQRRKERLLAQNKCPRHAGEEITPGTKCCVKCLHYYRNRYHARRAA